MGQVYKARDLRLSREVAIKVLLADVPSDKDRLLRFEDEAKAASLLSHPNIVAVYDIGDNNGSPYIVSELLQGETLRDRLATGPFPARKAVEHGIQILRGLAAAHDKGIEQRARASGRARPGRPALSREVSRRPLPDRARPRLRSGRSQHGFQARGERVAAGWPGSSSLHSPPGRGGARRDRNNPRGVARPRPHPRPGSRVLPAPDLPSGPGASGALCPRWRNHPLQRKVGQQPVRAVLHPSHDEGRAVPGTEGRLDPRHLRGWEDGTPPRAQVRHLGGLRGKARHSADGAGHAPDSPLTR